MNDFRLEEIEFEIEFPAPAITSVAFGGNDLSELYVTSGAKNLFDPNSQEITGGQLYRVLGLGVNGREMKSARIPK